MSAAPAQTTADAVAGQANEWLKGMKEAAMSMTQRDGKKDGGLARKNEEKKKSAPYPST